MNKFNWLMKACGVFLLLGAAAVSLPAQTTVAPTVTLTTLLKFDNLDGAGSNTLVQATDGNFYGTAGGGANICSTVGCGTVFKITPGGQLTTLYNFCSQGGSNCTDGEYPFAGLVQAPDGDFYGTTTNGGATSCGDFYGCGTAFKITPGGVLTTLHTFCSQGGYTCPDGWKPSAGLVQGANGDFYGTTANGGADNDGTVFMITPDGTFRTLHTFSGTEGENPSGNMVQATNGDFYGTTSNGGATSCGNPYGCGTVFKITPGGALTTLYDFCSQSGCTDGYFPVGGLVQATDGNFYGTTEVGGAGGFCNPTGCGTVFKITPSGTLTTLHGFDGTDGQYPLAGLVQATDGNFYGTSVNGAGTGCGGIGCGTVFKITPSGTLTTLHSFGVNGANGALPGAALIQATNGKFYGSTGVGGNIKRLGCGTYGCGTIFSLSVGLGPFVETEPTSGTVGAAVKILGSNLTGATSVTFNGTAAAFTVKSKSEITTTVPAGATTGTVQVATPSGTLSSNVPFLVR